MGRARIVEHLGLAQYMVVPLERDIELRTLRKQIESLEDKIGDQESVVEGKESDFENEQDALNDLILAGASHDEIQAQRYDCNMAEAEYGQALAELNALKLTLAVVQKKYDELPTDEEEDAEPVEAWCTDYSVFLTGEVDTIEIDGDTSYDIIIAPGGVAPVIPDTIALTVPAHSPTQAYFNWMIFPAWQRWMPTYRTGTIAAMFQDPVDIGPWYAYVVLDNTVSKAQGLPITPEPGDEPAVYTFDYMSCDHAAFTPGDRVIVAWPLRNWTEGVIIGFVSNPRPCDWHEQVMFRIGDMVSVYCPENDFVVLPPTPYMGPRYLEWYNRTIGALDVESPYDTVTYVLPDVLSARPSWYDMSIDSRVPVRKFCEVEGAQPMSGDVTLSDPATSCTFQAKTGNFLHSPAGFIHADGVGTLAARPSPSYDGQTYASYDNCRYFRAYGSPLEWHIVDWEESREAIYEHIWDYQHLGAYLMIVRGLPSWFEACWSLRLYNETQGEITVRQEFYQTVDLHAWTNYDDADPPGGGEWEEKAAEYDYEMANTWTYYSIGGQSTTGSFLATVQKAYGVDVVPSVLSYDWIGWGLRNTMRSGSTMVQSFIHECGHYTGTMDSGAQSEDITLFIAATCDYEYLTIRDVPGYNRTHNATFAAFLSALYTAAREHHGVASNELMNWMAMTREAGIYAYVPEEGLVYPYVIGVPDPEPEEEE